MIINNRPAPATLEPALPWLASAACTTADPDVFHPRRGVPAHEAMRICAACPVAAACLAYAVEHNEQGIWGGTTETERRRLRRQLRRRQQGRGPTDSHRNRVMCGSFRGYRKHRRDNTPTCEPCREAARAAWTEARTRRLGATSEKETSR